MSDDLTRAQSALASPFVDDNLFGKAFGGPPNDLSAVGRYLQTPVAERLVPSIYFDREFYLASNPDVQQQGVDPLLHFLTLGCAEQRSPHPLIDLKFMTTEPPMLLGAPPGIDALVQLLDHDLADPSPYFDHAAYRKELGPETAARGLLRHFLVEGVAAGRRPNDYLDLGWYVARYDDLPRDHYSALRHFIMFGDVEGRAPGPKFDGKLYLARYPDVVEAGHPPLRHFLVNGRHEGRHAAVERFRTLPHARERALAHRPADGDAPRLPAHDFPSAAVLQPSEAEETFASLRARIASLRKQRKDAAFVPHPMITVADPVGELAGIELPATSAPRVSVLIPMFNELSHTVACLISLTRAYPTHEIEVVIADDASSEDGTEALATIPNLVLVRQSANVGFIRNCNEAFSRCRGDYVLLLNNDTQLTPGAIDRLVDALDADEGIAAAGAKMIFPDGRLQEAGCAVTANGESVMVGLFRDPGEGGFTRNRDVAYCSGAALMLRRSAVGPVLFDEHFVPAYCEDVDLCLRLLDGGHRILFVAGAVVVHHLSVTSNRQPGNGRMRGIVVNQQRLVEKWGETLLRLDAIRPIAFYLPQFHATPENDLWWGAGFTEWTNVAKARPSYVGHYQPHLPADLGFYDLTSADAIRRQAALAARYGIEGFCVYYYNLDNRRVLSKPLEIIRDNPDIAFNFCLCWANENWTKHWDGGRRDVLLAQDYGPETLASVIADVIGFARDKRALRVNGKPLFLVYRVMQIPDPAGFAAACRAAFHEAGFPGVHLVYVESMEAVHRHARPADFGFDACVEFPPQGRAVAAKTSVELLKPGWSGYRYDYHETIMSFINRDSPPYVRYPAVFPSWDNTPRQPLRGTSFENASPEALRFFVEEKIDELRAFHMGEERLLFVNAWNEWAEGAHLEPDSGVGHGWLEALRAALDSKRFT